jgi:hypothetical protein
MREPLLVVGTCAVVLFAGVAGANNLSSGRIENGPSLPAVDAGGMCCMQNGFVVTQGIGCSNGTGTSGGPNECAERLTLCTGGPPVNVTTFSYIVVTPGIPGMVTNCSFAIWSDDGGDPAGPGILGCQRPSIPFATVGTFSIPIPGCHITPAMTNDGHFFAGLIQGGIGGMRWGYEDFGASNDAWIRASACGATTWFPLSAFGLPGDWVFRVCVQPCCPIEVEEFSWGEVKAKYR